ncbi:acetyltransferase [Legionella lansingensis]|uniref:Chloramphenicol acetyltransferase n=1 Tax=Legionella lansingensis TaxID=45067 RepID=A0A0W0VWD3_9GAMM|nr:acetyltransferase [Legionella lansingensis]KTD24346.1 chloramphenicol acetyltransferase [Legionella lansingensis]SNV51721.1 acetyltransferase [Legionella lansingensis]
MKSLAILGAGGHGKVIADAALCSGWEEIVFFDDKWPALNCVGIWDVIGDSQSFSAKASCFDGVIVGIGDNAIRLNKMTHLLRDDIPLATIIHPTATVSRFTTLGQGSLVCAGAVINPDSRIGIGSIINTGATVDHDCCLGDVVHISPGANLASGVQVGDLSWVGIGSSVRQMITIGARVIVGAGAVVIKDIPDDCTVIGVPAEIIENKKR